MTIVVRYLNPTANKALHVGHLRNAIVGEAVASALEFAGHDVVRQVLIEDVGLFMAEACLASLELDSDINKKFDVAVGEAYSRFREYTSDRSAIQASARRLGLAETPDLFAAALTDTSSTEWQLTCDVRNRVMEAQAETLVLLGLRFDEVAYESSELSNYEAVVARLKEAKLQRVWTATDRVRLRTGHIVNFYDAPSVPSENLLLLSFVIGQLAKPAFKLIVPIAGSEWRRHMGGYVDLLSAIFPDINCTRYRPVFTGVITQNGLKLSSRFGPVLLVDELLERIHHDVRSSFESASSAVASWMSSVVLKFPLILEPIGDDIEFSENSIFDQSTNAGWTVAAAILQLGVDGLARCRAINPKEYVQSRCADEIISATNFSKEAAELVLLAKHLVAGEHALEERFAVSCRQLGLCPPTNEFPWGVTSRLNCEPELV